MKNALSAALGAAALLIGLLAMDCAGALAQQEGKIFGILPINRQSAFSYVATPGQTITDRAVVENVGTEPVELKFYTADGYTSINGTIAFTTEDDERTGVRDWIDSDVSKVSLLPGQDTHVTFTVNVPGDAPPGDHVAGLVVEDAPEAAEGPVGAQVINRGGVAVIIRVPGDGLFEFLTLGPTCANRRTGSNYFEVGVQNSGTLLVDGIGTFTLVDSPSGIVVFDKLPTTLGLVVPGQPAALRIHPPLEIPGGRTYIATTALIANPGGRTVTTSETITLPVEKTNTCISPDVASEDEGPVPLPFLPTFEGCPPWWFFLLLLLAELLLILLIAREYRRRDINERWAVILMTVVAIVTILLFEGCYHWWAILVAIGEWLLGMWLVLREDRRRRRGEATDAEPGKTE